MSNATDKAAQCWCDPRVSDREMDVELATVFAETLEEAMDEPRLGLATTQELLDELKARAYVDGRQGLVAVYDFLIVDTYTERELEYKTVNRVREGSSAD